MKRRFLLAAVVMFVVAGCTGGDPDPTGSTTADTTTTGSRATTTSSPSESTTTSSEAAPLDARLTWLAGALRDGGITEEEYSANFTADFIANVPYDEFATVVSQISASGEGWSVGEFEDREGQEATVLLTSDAETIRANISLETVVPYRISGLLLQPAETPTLDDPPPDLETGAARIAEYGELDMAVFLLGEGGCGPVFEYGPGEAAPVGSAIKLYVLAAMADAVDAGDLSWDDEVTISDDLKSIPTGVLQDEEEGETFTLREVAETMIAFSDNTATDHLIDLVGRQAVEAALAEHGMTEPQQNIPFMTTLELAALKVGPASGLATQWLDADEDGRRAILDQLSDITPQDIPIADFTEPVLPDQIEWFATPEDICQVLADLYDMGEPLTQILTINPGLPDDSGNFEAVAYKGGSEPGLVSMNWLVERSDGRRYVLAGSVVNADENLDDLEVTLLFGALRDLIADL